MHYNVSVFFMVIKFAIKSSQKLSSIQDKINREFEVIKKFISLLLLS